MEAEEWSIRVFSRNFWKKTPNTTGPKQQGPTHNKHAKFSHGWMRFHIFTYKTWYVNNSSDDGYWEEFYTIILTALTNIHFIKYGKPASVDCSDIKVVLIKWSRCQKCWTFCWTNVSFSHFSITFKLAVLELELEFRLVTIGIPLFEDWYGQDITTIVVLNV